MADLPPHQVVREVVAYLASCSSLSGSPLTILQREYLQFIDSAQTLSSRGASSSSAAHARASRLLHGDSTGTTAGDHQQMEAVFVMSEATSSLRDVHSEFSSLQESYRKLAQESNAKDRRIASLQTELAKSYYDLQILRSGITSSHVVHASTVGDAELLHASQALNAQLAEQIAAFEDNYDVGNFVDVRELLAAVSELKKDKELLIHKDSLLAEKLLDSHATIQALQMDLKQNHSTLEDLRSLLTLKEREVILLKDELAHALENVR